jgi:chemotaxis protein MotB
MERVGRIIKEVADKIIRVEGHTDNVPIHPRLQEKYATNWELSNARATNVVRFLQDKIGIAPERLQAVGLSEFHPVASNKTREGRAKNRRIEIALLPIGEELEVAKE